MIKTTDIVYISGPMTGLPGFNHQAFYDAEQLLLEDFVCIVHNPAKSFSGRTDLERKTYMRHDIHLLLESTVVVLLPGWQRSQGSLLEILVAQELGLKILENGKPFTGKIAAHDTQTANKSL
jgi:hypothetical protein